MLFISHIIAVTLLLNAQVVAIICNPDLPVAEQARQLSAQGLTLLLEYYESEDYIFQEITQTLGKLMIERENLGIIAGVAMDEMLNFAGNLNALISGLRCYLAEISKYAEIISQYHAYKLIQE
ncbi:hypothetical protein J3U75_00665 [Snodgrassella sp. B3088]|uniref:hypothetical protein n=1 Tax=Snodgrassella sp. B3088 TaxID=2818038 RepID=UPI0022699C8D|nr:hypothetical protein [Snodgrassella sp. B3088]MCX8747898.1 hypothetical protein [Snodgrassella sp. B3088]